MGAGRRPTDLREAALHGGGSSDPSQGSCCGDHGHRQLEAVAWVRPGAVSDGGLKVTHCHAELSDGVQQHREEGVQLADRHVCRWQRAMWIRAAKEPSQVLVQPPEVAPWHGVPGRNVSGALGALGCRWAGCTAPGHLPAATGAIPAGAGQGGAGGHRRAVLIEQQWDEMGKIAKPLLKDDLQRLEGDCGVGAVAGRPARRNQGVTRGRRRWRRLPLWRLKGGGGCSGAAARLCSRGWRRPSSTATCAAASKPHIDWSGMDSESSTTANGSENCAQDLREVDLRHAQWNAATIGLRELEVDLTGLGLAVGRRWPFSTSRLGRRRPCRVCTGWRSGPLHHVKGQAVLGDVLSDNVVILQDPAPEDEALPVHGNAEPLGDELLHVGPAQVARDLELRRRPVDALDVHLVHRRLCFGCCWGGGAAAGGGSGGPVLVVHCSSHWPRSGD
mmetsp:Transcript_19436/g.61597  ORF Transcript_19436/g.61597 Transcript_19436/m.61597 type:complete len:445 (-) Transcript_19436:43-1377(-)